MPRCCESRAVVRCAWCYVKERLHEATCDKAERVSENDHQWREMGKVGGCRVGVMICGGCLNALRRRRRLAWGVVRDPIPEGLRQQVIERDGMQCRYCGCTVTRPRRGEPYASTHLHLDHVIPYSRVRHHSLDNLVVACADCNLSKGASGGVVDAVG